MPNLIACSRFLCRYDKFLATVREFVFQDRPNIMRRHRTLAPASTLFANIQLMTTCILQFVIYAFISHALPLRDDRRTELHVRSLQISSAVAPPCLQHLLIERPLTTTAFLHTLMLHMLIFFPAHVSKVMQDTLLFSVAPSTQDNTATGNHNDTTSTKFQRI
jgi:hypothetical protein